MYESPNPEEILNAVSNVTVCPYATLKVSPLALGLPPPPQVELAEKLPDCVL